MSCIAKHLPAALLSGGNHGDLLPVWEGEPVQGQLSCGIVRKATGFKGRTHEPDSWRKEGQLLTVSHNLDALGKDWPLDAFMVPYVVPGQREHARLCKDSWGDKAVGKYRVVAVLTHLFADFDAPNHGKDDVLSEEDKARWIEAHEKSAVLRHAGMCFSRRGVHLLWVLFHPILIVDIGGETFPVNAVLMTMLRTLSAAKLPFPPDMKACNRWTGLMGAPRTTRDGVLFRPDYENFDRMTPIETPEVVDQDLIDKFMTVPQARTRSPRSKRAAGEFDPKPWRPGTTSHLRVMVEGISREVRLLTTGRNKCFMALSGSLRDDDYSDAELRMVLEGVRIGSGVDEAREGASRAAEATIAKGDGQSLMGYGTLRRDWPAIADAYDLGHIAAERAMQPDELVPTADEQYPRMHELIRDAQWGLMIVAAECGGGKSHAMLDVVAERVRAGREESGRAKPHRKIGITVNQHVLGIQHCRGLNERGVDAGRMFSPPTLDDDDGAPVCVYHAEAVAVASAGLSVIHDLCHGGREGNECPELATCRAALGIEYWRSGVRITPGSPEDVGPRPLVTVGALAVLPVLLAHVEEGWLYVDELGSPVDTIEITADMLRGAIDARQSFGPRYAASLEPALEALLHFLAHGQLGVPTLFADAVAAHEVGVSAEVFRYARQHSPPDAGAVDCGRTAIDLTTKKRPGHRTRPVLGSTLLANLRGSPARAARVAEPARLLGTVYESLVREDPTNVTVEERRNGVRTLQLVRGSKPVAMLLNREGPSVGLDATVSTNLVMLESIRNPLLPKIMVEHFPSRDGAEVERTLMYTKRVSRTRLLRNGVAMAGVDLAESVDRLIEWVGPAKSLAVITHKPVRDLIERLLRGEAVGASFSPERRLQARLKELVGQLDRFELAHFGGTKGRNDLMGVECLATLGDPIPNINAIQNELALMGMAKGTPGFASAVKARVRALTRDALEQAHGRLRAPRLTAPARALHIGANLPGGSGWSRKDVTVVEDTGGRPTNDQAVTLEELNELVEKAGGTGAVARLFGCNRGTVQRWRKGKPNAPVEAVARLRAAPW